MMRGPIIHGVLLTVALLLAYQTWTREKKAEPKFGTVSVWSKPDSSLQALIFETKDRTVRLERRTDGNDTYYWGKEIRVTRKRPPPKPKRDKDAGPDDSKPAEESKTTTREFPGGEKAEASFKHFASLKALRNLGEVSESDKEKYGLSESTDNITAVFTEGEHSLILGGKVFGSTDRYVLDTESGRGYAIAGAVLRSLNAGETGLRVKKLHRFKGEEVGKARVATAKGAERTLVRFTVKGAKKDRKTWADAASPDKPDQTMANFIDQISKLRPSRFEPELDAGTLDLLVTVEYSAANGKAMGRFELFKEKPEPEEEPPPEEAPAEDDAAKKGDDAVKDANKGDEAKGPKKPEKKKPKKKQNYYVRTEFTRVLGKIVRSKGEAIDGDLAQIFEQ